MGERVVQREKRSASETERDAQGGFEFYSPGTTELLRALGVVGGGFWAIDFLDGHVGRNCVRFSEL